MYDVIIVGAGPAGSTAAKTLAENGYHVLLVEKFKMPRYKSCSGQLIRKSIDLVQKYFGATVPGAVMCEPTENRGMIFTDDKGREFRFEQSGFNVWRSSFDCFLATKAKESGAEIREETSVLSAKDENGIVTIELKGQTTYTEQARYLIDCEGVIGTLKRKILKTTPPYITTFQTYNKGQIDLDPHFFYAYLQPELSEYDAWFNVKDNQLVLGVAVKNPKTVNLYYDKFIRYMQDKHCLKIYKQVRRDRWLMPHIQPGCPIDYGIGRVLFAGEIAGFLNPMGEGISAGMESGYYAALSVAKHFDFPEQVLRSYQADTEALHDYMKRQWNFVAMMSDTFRDIKE